MISAGKLKVKFREAEKESKCTQGKLHEFDELVIYYLRQKDSEKDIFKYENTALSNRIVFVYGELLYTFNGKVG